jgi:hypothetical protein
VAGRDPDLFTSSWVRVRRRLLASGLEDLECFPDEFVADVRWGQRRARPIEDAESGSCLDLGDHLLQGAVAPVVEGACRSGEAVVAGFWVISSSRLRAPVRMVTARMAGEGGAGRSKWPMPLKSPRRRIGMPQFLARLLR